MDSEKEFQVALDNFIGAFDFDITRHDHLFEAWKKGRQAFLDGHPETENPYPMEPYLQRGQTTERTERSEWFRSYRHARSDAKFQATIAPRLLRVNGKNV